MNAVADNDADSLLERRAAGAFVSVLSTGGRVLAHSADTVRLLSHRRYGKHVPNYRRRAHSR